MRYLLWILFAAAIYGAIQWQLHDRPIPHATHGMLAENIPEIALGTSRPPWKDANGFGYRALADFQFTAVILSRKNYGMGDFAGLSPTDLAIGWGPLSDPVIYSQFKFDQRGSPLAGRFVFPEVVPGTKMATAFDRAKLPRSRASWSKRPRLPEGSIAARSSFSTTNAKSCGSTSSRWSEAIAVSVRFPTLPLTLR